MASNLRGFAPMIFGVVIAVVLLASLMPVFTDSTVSAGEKVNYTNESTFYKMAESDDVVTITLSSGTLTLNGETFEKTTNSNVLLSDVFSIDTFQFEGNWLVRAWYADSTNLSYPTAFDVEFSNGVATGTYTAGGVEYTLESPYSYLYYADSAGDYAQISGNASFTIYVNSVKDIVLSGLYYTGDSKTTYSYVDGVLSTHEDYTSSISFTTEEVGLDVLKVTGVSVTIGEDAPFTPFRILAPAAVVGHTETPASDLLGIIPLLVVVGLIIGVIGAIAVRREY